MTDDRFELELRGVLAARAPSAASAGLRSRLAAIPLDAPAAVPRLGGRPIIAWRAVLGFAATVAVAVLAIAVLTRLGASTLRDGDTVGAPTNGPVPAAQPFVTAPSGFFTAAAIADAQSRLDRVFRATGVEATLVVQDATSGSELSTPAGWPEAYDRDDDPRRDVTAVVGVGPGGTTICCLTLVGPVIEQATEDNYWRPIDRPTALDDELTSATAEGRDAGLRGFVRGIEDMSAGMTELGHQFTFGDILPSLVPILLVLPLLALAVIGLRRRPVAVGASGWAISDDIAESIEPTALEPAVAPVAAPVTAARVPVTQPAGPWSDRFLVLLALAALGCIALLALTDLLVAPDPGVPLDPAGAKTGIDRAAFPALPLVLAATAVGALIIFARRGSWRGRLGILSLILIVGSTAWIAIDGTRPIRPEASGWAASPNGTVTSRDLDGIMDTLSYAVAPGETFTFAGAIRNAGVLPMSVLGLDHVASTSFNPFVASIVGVGWVVQPVDDGRVHRLSARLPDASASWPVTLGPGEELAIVLVGRAGPCAGPNQQHSQHPLFRIPVSYRVLGVERSEEVDLAAAVWVQSTPEACTVEVPGGTITYGP